MFLRGWSVKADAPILTECHSDKQMKTPYSISHKASSALTCMVSAVSPDWLTKTHMSSRKMGERLSSKSLASSKLTGRSVRLSTVWRQARQAW